MAMTFEEAKSLALAQAHEGMARVFVNFIRRGDLTFTTAVEMFARECKIPEDTASDLIATAMS